MVGVIFVEGNKFLKILVSVLDKVGAASVLYDEGYMLKQAGLVCILTLAEQGIA